MDLNETTNRLLEIKAAKAELSRQEKTLSEEEFFLKGALVDMMSQLGTSELTIHDKSFKLRTKQLPAAEDWDAIYAFISENNAFHLLHKRLAATVLADMKENGLETPGIKWTEEYTVTY
jgi:hypothetical protein